MSKPFKTGDTIELINDDEMGAPIGSRAKVTGYSLSADGYRTYVEVKWISETTQMDGGYETKDFKLCNTEWDEQERGNG